MKRGSIRNYFLGCPVWANRKWVGTLFSADARPPDFLKQYSRVFNSVEGNTTFYGLPRREIMQRWSGDVPENFRFCLKFPRTISHTSGLLHAGQETITFLKAIEPLSPVTGLVFLQLPPSFAANGLPDLDQFLGGLPLDYAYGVEVRHSDFFYNEPVEQRFHEMLRKHGVNRVLFDTAVLHSLVSSDESIREAQRRKPRNRELLVATAKHPVLRFVGHNLVSHNLERLRQLAQQCADWIQAGLTPYVFIHSPDDFYAPEQCRQFHNFLSSLAEVGELGHWGSETESQRGQLDLFD